MDILLDLIFEHTLRTKVVQPFKKDVILLWKIATSLTITIDYVEKIYCVTYGNTSDNAKTNKLQFVKTEEFLKSKGYSKVPKTEIYKKDEAKI